MTEHEWLTATDPQTMLQFLETKPNYRKLRLLACAFCRRHWHLLRNIESQQAVAVGEQLADELATEEERFPRWAAAVDVAKGEDPANLADRCLSTLTAWVASQTCNLFGFMSSNAVTEAVRIAVLNGDERALQEQAELPTLTRHIFGNPFHAITIDRRWLTPRVSNLAQTIYEDRQLPTGLFDNVRLGILADALEDAGCDNTDILGHLRGGGDHVRGCWVVDLLLDKE